MRYRGGGVGHIATRHCNRTLLADEHTIRPDEHLPLAWPQPTANQDNESEGEDSDEAEGEDDLDGTNVHLSLHNLNDTANILDVAGFAAF